MEEFVAGVLGHVGDQLITDNIIVPLEKKVEEIEQNIKEELVEMADATMSRRPKRTYKQMKGSSVSTKVSTRKHQKKSLDETIQDKLEEHDPDSMYLHDKNFQTPKNQKTRKGQPVVTRTQFKYPENLNFGAFANAPLQKTKKKWRRKTKRSYAY